MLVILKCMNINEVETKQNKTNNDLEADQMYFSAIRGMSFKFELLGEFPILHFHYNQQNITTNALLLQKSEDAIFLNKYKSLI